MDQSENIFCVPGAAGGHAQRLLVAGLPEAADREDDRHQHQRHGRRQHHVQPQVEVGALRQPAHLNIGTSKNGDKNKTRQFKEELCILYPTTLHPPPMWQHRWRGCVAS